MQSLKTRTSLVTLFLVLAVSACQAGSPTLTATVQEKPAPSATALQKPTATPAVEPSSTSAPQPAPTATQAATPTVEKPAQALPTLPPSQPGPETLVLTKLPVDPGFSDFTESYQVDVRFTDTDSVEQQTVTVYSYRQQTIPVAAWTLLFKDNNPFLASNIESAVIGQQAFSATPDTGCQAVNIDQLKSNDPRQAFRSLLQALTGQATRSEAGAMLGDQETDLYTLEAMNLKPGSEVVLQATAADSNGELSLTSSSTITLVETGTKLESGKLYLARQGGYIRRIELVYSRIAGEADAFFAKPGSSMKRTLIYETLLAGAQDKPILPPAGCENLSSGTGGNTGGSTPIGLDAMPFLEDVSNKVETEDSVVYQTHTSLPVALDFYRNQMTALGWEVSDENVMDTMATLELTRGDQTVSITLLQSGDLVTVTILLT